MHREVINLTEQQMEFLQSAISSGLNEDINEAVHRGLKLLQEKDQEILDAKAGILEGLAQARRGELVDGERAIHDAFLAAEKNQRLKQGATKKSH